MVPQNKDYLPGRCSRMTKLWPRGWEQMCYVTASRNPDTQMGKGYSVSHVTRLHNMGQTSHWELEKMDTECKVNLLESIGKLITQGHSLGEEGTPERQAHHLGLLSTSLRRESWEAGRLSSAGAKLTGISRQMSRGLQTRDLPGTSPCLL